MHAFPLPGLSQILCENNTYIHFVLLCLADAFLFYISGFVRSNVCSFFIPQPILFPLHPSPKFQNSFLDRPVIDYINWISWKVKGGGCARGVELEFLLLAAENGSRWTDLVNDSKRISPAESGNILCYTYANLPSQVLFLKRMYSLFLLSSVNSAFWIEEMGTAQRPQ